MWSGRDHAGGPAGPVLAGGADGPGGVGREVGHWDRLDAARQRISTCKELQARTGSGGDLRSVLVDGQWPMQRHWAAGHGVSYT